MGRSSLRIFVVVATMAVAIGALTTRLSAEQTPRTQEFRGLTSVRIVVEGLPDDATKCGLNTESIDTSVRLPLAASGLKVAPEAVDWVYVNVNVLALSNSLCVASASLELNRWSIDHSAFVIVYQRGGLMTGSAGDFGARMRRNIEDRTKDFVAAWLKATSK